MANWHSRGDRQLEKTAADGFSGVTAKVGAQRCRCVGSLRWRKSVNSGVDSISIVVFGQVGQLPCQILFVREQGVIEEFAANGSDESLNEGVRCGNARQTAEVVDREYPQVCTPS